MNGHFLLLLIAFSLVMLGLVGILLPILPGTPIIFFGLLLAAWANDFETVHWPTLLAIGVLCVISLIIDILASTFGVKFAKASKLGVWGTTIGTLIGMFFFPVGLLIGPFLGAWIGEMLHGRTVEQASRIGLFAWLGLAFGTACKLAIGVGMVGLFLIAAYT